MKKHTIIALSLLSCLTACHPDRQHSQAASEPIAVSAPTASAAQPANNAAAGEFADVIQATQAVKQKLANANLEQGDRLYAEHRQQMSDILASLNTRYTAFLENYDNEQNWQNVASEPRQPVGEMKQRLEDLAAAQLMIKDTGMGVMQIAEQPDYYGKIFNEKVSEDVEGYIRLQAMNAVPLPESESAEPLWTELSKRLVSHEEFLISYPSSAYRIDVEKQFNHYADLFLLGSEDDPVTVSDHPLLADSKQEYAEIEKKWAEFAKKNPNSTLVPIMDEAKKIAHMEGKQGEERFEAAQNFRKVHFKTTLEQ